MTIFNSPVALQANSVEMTNCDFSKGFSTAPKALNLNFNSIDVELNSSAPILWCWMRPLGKPIVTNDLLSDLKSMHRMLPAILDTQTRTPIEYYVFGSRARNTYRLGGDLNFFGECVRASKSQGDLRLRSQLHRCGLAACDLVQSATNYDGPGSGRRPGRWFRDRAFLRCHCRRKER